jgi:hypothetical protein
MAQTKRKRRNKHRGNAVGVVEARGRTSKPRPDAKPAKGSTARRPARQPLKPPTFKGAATKAGVGALILFVFFALTDKSAGAGGALVFCLVAMLLYTPVMYWTDKWVYNRKLRAQQGGGGSPRGQARG